MAELRTALVGAGVMGKNHARVLNSLDGVELVALVDPEGDPRNVGQGAKLVPSVERLSAEHLDLAVVATPTAQHEENVASLIEMGLHVFVEKPISFSSKSGERMAALLKKSGLFGAVGHIERFNPAIQEMWRRLREMELGEVYQIATRRQGSFPERIGDVGVVMDLATHDIDFTTWLADSDYHSVFGLVNHKAGRTHEDMVAVTATLKSGTIVSHLVNWLSPMKERTVAVTGENGTFVADTLTSDLTFYENGNVSVEWDNLANFRGVSEGLVTRLVVNKREPLRLELEGFRDLIRTGQGAHISFDEAIKAVRVAEGILESAKRGSPVMW